MADPFADVSIPPQPVVVFPDDVEELLDEGCALFPVVADKRGQAVLPYSYAKSDDSFRAWNLGKRKSTEVRAHRPFCALTWPLPCADVSVRDCDHSGSVRGRSGNLCGAGYSSTFPPRRWSCGAASITRFLRYVPPPPL
jgi:hypothetical protein